MASGLEYISPEGLRVDGRRPPEFRKLECQLGKCQQADGSAFLQQGNTKVIATVYGPHDVSRRSEAIHNKAYINCQYSVATFSTSERRRRPRGDRKSNEISHAMKKAFETAILTELYPMSKIDIFVEVLQSDGGNHAACINAVTMALIDAGVPMKDFVCACNAGFIDDTPLVDMNYLEEGANGPNLTVAILPKSDKIVLLELDYRLHCDNLEKILSSATKGCDRVHTILNTFMQQHLKNYFELNN